MRKPSGNRERRRSFQFSVFSFQFQATTIAREARWPFTLATKQGFRCYFQTGHACPSGTMKHEGSYRVAALRGLK